ncbi:MAG: alpha-glucosidase, partial [Thermoleophilia bacterium]|nr:alpha-glucosidase [Thermoleophilia bacterium]
LDIGARIDDRIVYTAPGGEADVYLFGPGTPAQLLADLARLTGHQPLPPAWTLGFLQSRFGYETFDHVHETLERFEQERLPVHGLVFDVQWLEHHINLKWDPKTFPDPAANLARIAQRGVRTIVISEPGTTSIASNYESGVAADAFVQAADGTELDSRQWYTKRGISQYRTIEPSNGALLNVFADRTADWWYAQHLPLLEQGVDAWWLDLNEPEDVGPEAYFPRADWPAERELLRGAEVRGNFAIAQQRLFAQGDLRHSTRRPFVLSRASSTGSQRYGASPWTGDVGATWHDFRVQSRLVLTAGMCGMPLSGSDVGGFNGDPGPELFTRWVQAGSVMPIFRAHGYMEDREPWSQGAEALEAVRPSLLLRAQLLPSIVTWAQTAIEAGEPLARPMLLGPLGTPAGSGDAVEYATDARWANCDDQWFFGPLLAAPVLEEGARTRVVQLPPGPWVDVWTKERHEGGGSITVDVDLASLPLFVQPTVALLADAEPLAGRGHDWPPQQLEAWSWATEEGEVATARLYLDDGITRAHEEGAYCLQEVAVADGELTVARIAGSFPASGVRVATPAPGHAPRGDETQP